MLCLHKKLWVAAYYTVHLLTVIKAAIKAVKSSVLPYDGGSIFVIISILCIGIQQVSSRLGLKNWAAGPYGWKNLMFTS